MIEYRISNIYSNIEHRICFPQGMFLTSRRLSAHALPVTGHCDETFRENMFNCAFRQLRGRGSKVEGCGGRGGDIDIPSMWVSGQEACHSVVYVTKIFCDSAVL